MGNNESMRGQSPIAANKYIFFVKLLKFVLLIVHLLIIDTTKDYAKMYYLITTLSRVASVNLTIQI